MSFICRLFKVCLVVGLKWSPTCGFTTTGAFTSCLGIILGLGCWLSSASITAIIGFIDAVMRSVLNSTSEGHNLAVNIGWRPLVEIFFKWRTGLSLDAKIKQRRVDVDIFSYLLRLLFLLSSSLQPLLFSFINQIRCFQPLPTWSSFISAVDFQIDPDPKFSSSRILMPHFTFQSTLLP